MCSTLLSLAKLNQKSLQTSPQSQSHHHYSDLLSPKTTLITIISPAPPPRPNTINSIVTLFADRNIFSLDMAPPMALWEGGTHRPKIYGNASTFQIRICFVSHIGVRVRPINRPILAYSITDIWISVYVGLISNKKLQYRSFRNMTQFVNIDKLIFQLWSLLEEKKRNSNQDCLFILNKITIVDVSLLDISNSQISTSVSGSKIQYLWRSGSEGNGHLVLMKRPVSIISLLY